MSGFVVRAARPDDLPLLADIEREADGRFVGTGHPELLGGEAIGEEVAARAMAAGRLTVAEVDGVVAGWLFATRCGAELCVGEVSVSPCYGRRGIGTALLRDVVDRARLAGEPAVVLNTQADIPWNMPWYARLGFVVVPREAWTAGMRAVTADQTAGGFDWSTRVHMRLTLG